MLSALEESSLAQKRSTLRSCLDDGKPLYILPRENIVDDVLIPAFECADSVDCMMGFFSSRSLAEIAPGMANYLARSEKPLRLVVSPYLSADDQKAIREGLKPAEAVASEAIISLLPNADEIAEHTLSCLSWLIKEKRILIRIALMRDGLFHTKAWIFRTISDSAALHGSSNMTQAGLKRNREQLTLSRSWKGEESQFTIVGLQSEFESLWRGGDEDCTVVDLPKAVEKELLQKHLPGRMPTELDFRELWRRANELEAEPVEVKNVGPQSLVIPDNLDYRSGDFSHQGQAVDAWRATGWRGVLEMATGSGKTITAMVGATLLYQEVKSLLIVISAPYVPLIQQWCGEIEPFGARPIDLTSAGGPAKREKAIKDCARRLKMGISNVEILVVSNDTLSTSEFIDVISSVSTKKLLISDEVHNLGSAKFIQNPPQCFDYRLGLSATPIRQYDEEGTEALFNYFGDVCFSFTLEQAIGRCLTPYDYYVHMVELSKQEMERWLELSDQISSQSWKFSAGKEDSYLENLLRLRRLVLETATEKIEALSKLLDLEDPRRLRYTLVYATDKDPTQLDAVNDLLSKRRILAHQLTQEETSDRNETRQILAAFQSGELQVLTAKRVLDEGVNIPQIMKAFILASTTVKRQWVQRRGRLLRKCKEIGKTHAVIHDFVVVPPGADTNNRVELDPDARKIVRGELERVWEFARLSRNGADEDGTYRTVQRLQRLSTGQ